MLKPSGYLSFRRKETYRSAYFTIFFALGWGLHGRRHFYGRLMHHNVGHDKTSCQSLKSVFDIFIPDDIF